MCSGGDSRALADVIVRLLDNRSRRLEIGRVNRNRALDSFSVEAMVEEYGRLYSALLEEKP